MTDTFTVWAPRASRVDLVLDGDRLAMEPGERGGWSIARAAPAGCEYGFALDGGDPLPDPRSPWQPTGVHGPSRTVDHGLFGWTDGDWQAPPLRDAVIYELHVGTFTAEGTFASAIEHLPHLTDLGVTHLELMPVAEFSGHRGWGYDGVNLFAPHHIYGGPDGLKQLVNAAHAHGLGVLLDVVYNHLGPEGNHLDRFGPYFTDRYQTPWGDAVNYDGPGSDEVRRFVIDNALAWLRDYHIDGLRLDAVHAIFDASAVHICEELRAAVGRLSIATRRRLAVIAESDANDPRLVRAPGEGGYGLDAVWADDVHHALHAALTGERDGYYADFNGLPAVADALRDPHLWPGRYRAFRERRHGAAADGLGGDRFVAFLQNHDQVGNRALGERIGHLVGPGRAKAGAALLLTAPYVPLLFAGEEWSAGTPFQYFTGLRDRAVVAGVREGRREEFAEFGWEPEAVPDPQQPDTFETSKLDWSEPSRMPHRDVLGWYRDLIALRRERPELCDGRRVQAGVTHDPRAGWIALRRGPLTVAANLGPQTVQVPAEGAILRASEPAIRMRSGSVELPPDGAAVLEAR